MSTTTAVNVATQQGAAASGAAPAAAAGNPAAAANPVQIGAPAPAPAPAAAQAAAVPAPAQAAGGPAAAVPAVPAGAAGGGGGAGGGGPGGPPPPPPAVNVPPGPPFTDYQALFGTLPAAGGPGYPAFANLMGGATNRGHAQVLEAAVRDGRDPTATGYLSYSERGGRCVGYVRRSVEHSFPPFVGLKQRSSGRRIAMVLSAGILCTTTSTANKFRQRRGGSLHLLSFQNAILEISTSMSTAEQFPICLPATVIFNRVKLLTCTTPRSTLRRKFRKRRAKISCLSVANLQGRLTFRLRSD